MKKRLSKLLIFTMLIVALPLSAAYADGVPVTVANASATVGETVEVTVSIDGVSEMGGGQVDLVYDPTVLAPSTNTSPYGVVQGAFIDSLGTFTVNLNEMEHKFVVLWADFSLNTVSGSGDLFTITLNAVSKGDATVTLENLNIANSAGTAISSIAQNGTVKVTATPAYALAQVNAATDAGGMQMSLETYSTELGLTMTDYSALGASYKTAVATEVLSGIPYANLSEVVNTFDSAVSSQDSSQDLDGAIAQVNAAAGTSAMQTALVDNASLLGIDLSAYNVLSVEGKANTADAMIEGRSYASASAIKSEFDAAVQTETDREALEDAVEYAETEVRAAEDLVQGDLSSQGLIDAAQQQIDKANNAVLDVLDLDDNYNTSDWERDLNAAQTDLDQAQAIFDAVNAAITAIDAIPEVGDGHEAATQNARTKADAALAMGAFEEDITNYDELLAAEAIYYHGYLVGSLQRPNDAMTTTTLKVYLDGQMIGQKTVDFTNGPVSFTGQEFTITEFTPGDENTLLTVTIPGYVYKYDLGIKASVQDIDRGGANGSDTLDLSAITILPIAGDANNDGDIDIADLAVMAQTFNTTVAPTDFTVNYNGDTKVDVKDLYFIGLNFGY